MSATTVGIVANGQDGVLGNIRPTAERVRSSREHNPILSAEIATSLQDQLDAIYRLISAFSVTIPDPVPSSSSVIFDTHTLTANSTINASVMPPPANTLLVVKLIWDATGTWVATFNAAHFSDYPSGLTRLASTVSTIIFIADGAKWRQAAPPMTGRP